MTAPSLDITAGSRNFADLLRTRSIAVVGATESSFAGTAIQRNLARYAFTGRVAQVHPSRTEVDGRACAPSLAALEEVPDLVCLLTAPHRVPELLIEAEELGVRWALVPGGGHAESAQEAETLGAWLAEPGRGLRVIGPNCMGFVAVPERLTAYIGTAPASLREGDVALVSQSGAVVEAFATQGSRIGYRLLVSVGNQADVTSEDVIEALLDEGRVRVILLWQEGVRDASRHLRLLERAAAADVRVGIVRSGRSSIARAAAMTHTGAISGDWELWARLARRQGAAVLETLDELHEFGALAQAARSPASRRIWALTNSGGQGSQLADGLAAAPQVELPAPTPAHREAFAALFPQSGRPSNPIDLWNLGDWQAACEDGARLVVEHGGNEGLLLASIDAAPDQGRFEGELAATMVAAVSAAVAGRDGWQALHLAPLGAPGHPALVDALAVAGCPSVRGDAGVRALVAFLAPTGPPIPAERLDALAGGEPAGERIGHALALDLLAGAAIAVPRTVLAATPAEAARLARGLTAPLVVKVVGPAHRARLGGVALGVPADGVAAVCERMSSIPGCEGFELVEHAVGDLELLVHVADDPQLGPRATLGAGGALAERTATTVCDLAPQTRQEARELIIRLVGAEAEAAASGWVDAVAEVLLASSRLVADGWAGEIEINPLAVDRLAAKAVAVDVLARGGGTR